jgi:inorganic phosphate transporter, PiT family
VSLLGEPITMLTAGFLVLALGLALSFEFVNGFHDTANAVATVIYTHSLRPWIAVIWSGLWNLTGVLVSTGAVAFGVVALLPVELVINVGSGAGWAMVFALLISAILWNLGTWYLGLPASSSHTLIGSIMGVGLANSMLSTHVFGEGVNWVKAKEVGASLLISPLVGFFCAGLLLLLAKALIKRPELYHAPDQDKGPPHWIRGLLILTCTGVSFAHGSNDGQKGMGLIMLILIGILPGAYALNSKLAQNDINKIVATATVAAPLFQKHAPSDPLTPQAANEAVSQFLKTTGVVSDTTFAALAEESGLLAGQLQGKTSFADLPRDDRKTVRSEMYLVQSAIDKLVKQKKIADPGEQTQLVDLKKELEKATKFIPDWVKVAVALALGLGTMIGWKRIVVTVGEKIGKSHLTYAQGASAELVAMCTIGAADWFGLPVSTTHVLSSGVAGTMAANKSGVQMDTLRNLLLAWVLTLPVCVFLGAATFAAGFYIVLALGLK